MFFHFYPFVLADLFHSFKLFPSFLRSFLSISLAVPPSRAPLHCGIEGPTCKQFPHKIKLGPVPFHIGSLAYPGPCLLQVGELARTEVNGWKSLTNLSNSCLQSPLFLVPSFDHVSPCFFSLLLVCALPSLPKNRG